MLASIGYDRSIGYYVQPRPEHSHSSIHSFSKLDAEYAYSFECLLALTSNYYVSLIIARNPAEIREMSYVWTCPLMYCMTATEVPAPGF